MAKRGVETAIVSRPGVRTRLGDLTPGAVVGPLTGCIVWPRTSSENADRGVVIIDGYEVWAPAPITIDIKATDVINVRGEDWNIEGRPGDYRKNGVKLGLMLLLKRSGI